MGHNGTNLTIFAPENKQTSMEGLLAFHEIFPNFS